MPNFHANRRRFLQAGAATAAGAFTATAPDFLLRLGRLAAASPASGDRILVIVQLSGGNDGLNTVIPYADDLYARNRFTLRVPADRVLKLDDHVGLHPAMAPMHELFKDGLLTVVQGVGYPNPNRSHFASMDIWHTARLDAPQDANPARRTGWIGRCLDRTAQTAAAPARDVPCVHLGAERQPLAVVADRVRVPSVQSIEGFRLQTGDNPRLEAAIARGVQAPRNPQDPSAPATQAPELLNFLQQSTVAALDAGDQLRRAQLGYQSPIKYPGNELGQKLRTIAQMIAGGLSPRVYYVSLPGFDTHANQGPAHEALLRELSAATASFIRDLAHHRLHHRVTLACFSEFGRRIKENASRGTDHGVAGPVLLAGGALKSTLVGSHPSLSDTDEGDLKQHTDFRSVYATLIQHVLRLNPRDVLHADFPTLPLLKA